MDDLLAKRCKACEGGVAPLSQEDATQLLQRLSGWALNEASTEIARTFSFKNYYHTMAFVNALAYIANVENHHPDLEVSYNRCTVRFSTHSIKGLSENDFICAAKTDQLIAMKNA